MAVETVPSPYEFKLKASLETVGRRRKISAIPLTLDEATRLVNLLKRLTKPVLTTYGSEAHAMKFLVKDLEHILHKYSGELKGVECISRLTLNFTCEFYDVSLIQIVIPEPHLKGKTHIVPLRFHYNMMRGCMLYYAVLDGNGNSVSCDIEITRLDL